MRFATRTLLAAFALVLWTGTASAQNDVTFQVNMQSFINSCQFDPTGTPPADTVFVRGSFNGFDKSLPLTDDNSDGVFTGTASLAEGAIDYKFNTSNEAVLGWENDVNDGGPNGNRDYTVVAGAQTIPVATYNKPVEDKCGTVDKTYDLTFVVDMSTAIGRGDLDPDTETVAVAGSFTDWGNGAVALQPESDNPNLYSGTVEDVVLAVPGGFEFKFIIRTPDGASGFTDQYENPSSAVSPTRNGNRLFSLTGDEDADADGTLQAEYDNDGDIETFVRFGDASRLLTAAATVTYVVDLRPAFYAFADSSSIPGGITDAADLDDAYINGPLFGESDGVTEDWATWTTDGLGEARKLTFNSADTTASIVVNYSEGAYTVLTGKLSVGGADNEAGMGTNKTVTITEGTQTIDLIFGAQIQADGSFVDDAGGFDDYDPYILIDNTVTPPTASVVRRGGSSDVVVGIEDGPAIAGLAIGAAYPNPTRGLAKLDLQLDRALDLRVALYDVVGRQVATLADGPVAAGETTLELAVDGLAPGVYLLRVEADGQAVVRRMTVLR